MRCTDRHVRARRRGGASASSGGAICVDEATALQDVATCSPPETFACAPKNIRHNDRVGRVGGQISLFREARKPRRGRPPVKGSGLPHTRRPAVDPRHPHHVTVRVRHGTWNLRSQRSFGRIAAALDAVRAREGFRITHFSVQGNHIHMLAEAADRRAMSNGLRALLIRVARGLNRMMGASGPRFADRYHERALTGPTQVHNALRYVVGNHAVHLARLGKEVPRDPDPFSSLARGDLASKPASWLLRTGWQRAGPE